MDTTLRQGNNEGVELEILSLRVFGEEGESQPSSTSDEQTSDETHPGGEGEAKATHPVD